MKDGSLHVPRPMSYTKSDDRRRDVPPRLQGWPALRDTSWFVQELAHKVEHLALTLLRANSSTNTHKVYVKSKNLITKHFDWLSL